MQVRRVVTGHTPAGKSIVASDTVVDALTVALMPGSEHHRLWGSDETPTFPDGGGPHPMPAFFPPVGGFRFGLFTLPPLCRTARAIHGATREANPAGWCCA
jgi:hypothetical protein